MTARLDREEQGGATTHPFYLTGTKGPLFCVHVTPAARTAPRGGVLYLPPFAEESNRARRMAILQARRLAARGWSVLLLDLFGTGDSGGEFHDARWEVWLDDADRAAKWLAGHVPGQPLVLWGVRLGGLLATALAAKDAGRFQRLLLWQPVLRGDRFVTQFLRLRVAAAMAAGEKETTQTLRERIAAGERLEVAGYELAPNLVSAIDNVQIEQFLDPLARCALDWFELVPADREPTLAPASKRLWDTQSGATWRNRVVAGEPFWSIQEITLAPHLLEATDALFA